MKKIHLLCNAHLDPVWLWQWGEGAAEAISTFRVAADFCEEFDGFVFNHNEALLYEWVEKYEPELFARIQKLVKEGKWKIMGGWYLQPDCVMLSGESFKNQIALGREYFEEKFGQVPTTAINFDPFGHTRGLVQILKNEGYDSYIFMRPYEIEGDFWWEGYDGSRVLGHGIYGGYNTLKGQAVEKIEEFIKDRKEDICLCLWGIGNHGGGPSRVDLENITEFMKSNGDAEVVHSSAEEYFADIDKENIPVISESLIPCMVGCYTSMVRIKQANRRLENKIAMTEKIMSYAEMQTDFEFNKKELDEVKRTLAFCQFHDILPGSAIKPVEEDSLRAFAHGEEKAEKLYTQAFFKLCEGQKKVKDGEIPILIFNPHPYEIEGEFEIGFMNEDQNWTDNEITISKVYDENGNFLPTQNEKPECTFHLDWIQKVSFRAKIAPSSITRFDCTLERIPGNVIEKNVDDLGDICVKNDKMEARISRKTGLIELYKVGGKTFIENSGALKVYKDNEDPWGMNVDSFTNLEGEFTLMSDADANEFIGYPDEKYPAVRIVEDGEVRMKVQALFEYKRNVAVVEYTIPKQGAYIDTNITLFSNEPNRMIKYCLDTKISGKPWGETAFGMEELYSDEKESVFQKWCGIRGEDSLYIVNRGIYGGSFTENSIKMSLLRTAVYSAHPIKDRQIAPHNRFMNHIDMGERIFSFRITTEENIEREAQVYNEAPYLMSFFPSGEGEAKSSAVTIDNPDIILSSVKKNNAGKFEVTLHNFADCENDAELIFGDKKLDLHFGKFELKTVTI